MEKLGRTMGHPIILCILEEALNVETGPFDNNEHAYSVPCILYTGQCWRVVLSVGSKYIAQQHHLRTHEYDAIRPVQCTVHATVQRCSISNQRFAFVVLH